MIGLVVISVVLAYCMGAWIGMGADFNRLRVTSRQISLAIGGIAFVGCSLFVFH